MAYCGNDIKLSHTYWSIGMCIKVDPAGCIATGASEAPEVRELGTVRLRSIVSCACIDSSIHTIVRRFR